MNGYYYYNSEKKRWVWYIKVMDVQVDSGTCANKNELNKMIDSKPMYRWYDVMKLDDRY